MHRALALAVALLLVAPTAPAVAPVAVVAEPAPQAGPEPVPRAGPRGAVAVRVAAVWVAPVPVVVVRPFAAPPSRYAAGHRGADLAAAAGAPVLAAGAGTVVQAGPVGGRPVVSVEHADGLRTTYEPVLPTVRRGQVVRAGEVLGTLGPVHAGCGACLHWGLRRAGPDGPEYLDPLVLLRRGPSRLLPTG